MGPVLFLLYINELPKIINKTSAPIIFADDTSVLFAHTNPIDFNKNIYIVFITLNKWLRANQLSLNFNKTNYVQFTTKRNMSVNLKIGFNNNFIINSSYTKFLGVTMHNTLSWNNHIDLISYRNLFKKLQILSLTSQYMLSLLMFVVQNKNLFLTNNENHNLDTRQRNNLYLPQTNLTIYQKGAYYSGIKIFNNLHLEMKNVAGNQEKFKIALKKFYTLILHS